MKPSAYRWNLAAIQAIAPQEESSGPYAAFQKINGNHPWKFAVPNGYIDYQVRILRKSKILFFNFALAKEMGLIPADHPHVLNKDLEKTLIETFALRIINEYDQLTGATFPARDIKANRYMATRYLQLQHNNKTGCTSGDGRSMWNGYFLNEQGIAWDISSCGTGVTRLSPGSVHEGRPVKTGDKKISYGSGLADVDEGLTAAILSESFHARGIMTERTLVIVEDPEGNGINVRTAKNLLRPSHLFLHLKQGNQLMLKSALDFHIAKEINNKVWPASVGDSEKYDVFLSRTAQRMGEFTARLEDEYIFCWLDWDGDNMLMDAGIIDYGSIRQFGLCHHTYRYDDVDRFSTNLKEQKQKAKYLMQTFIQMVDFVRTGQKKDLRTFRDHPFVKQYEDAHDATMRDRLLKRIGLSPKQRRRVLERKRELVLEFEKAYRFFERKEKGTGLRRTPDGVNDPAIFNVRNLLRELPKRYLLAMKPLESQEFLALMSTPYLTKKDLGSRKYDKAIGRFQRLYVELVRSASKTQPLRRSLLEAAMRAGEANRSDYATGDGIIHVVDYLLAKRKGMSRNEFGRLVDAFIQYQCGRPYRGRLRESSRRVLQRLFRIVADNKYSI